MLPLIEQHREAIAALCTRYGVERLDVFGSALDASRFDPERSDIDLLYVFDTRSPRLADRYFAFVEAMESLLGRRVDLVSDLDITNPYFRQRVERERVVLYAA